MSTAITELSFSLSLCLSGLPCHSIPHPLTETRSILHQCSIQRRWARTRITKLTAYLYYLFVFCPFVVFFSTTVTIYYFYPFAYFFMLMPVFILLQHEISNVVSKFHCARRDWPASEEVRQPHAHAPCGQGARCLIACFTYHVYCMYHVRSLCICK